MNLLSTVSDTIVGHNINISHQLPELAHDNLKISQFLSKCKTTKGSMFNFPIHMNVEIEDTTLLETTNCYNKDIRLFNQYRLEPVIKRLYSKIADNQEVSYLNWIFFALDKVKEMVISNKQDHFIEIASSYIGMGWVRVLCWDKELQKYFIHTDGGENGYTQNDHYDYFHADVDHPKGFNLNKDTSKVFTFNEFLEMDQSDFDTKMYKMPF